MTVSIIRPDLSVEKRTELERYLGEYFDRAEAARTTQLQKKFDTWNKIYYGERSEKTRNIPWYNSSNYVVKLVRIFADTFLARTLNILFATRPLYTVEGYPSAQRGALEEYLNLKAIRQWGHYQLARDFIGAGNKNGTATIKTVHVEKTTWEASEDATGASAKEVTLYSGPQSSVIPFDDWNCYPITAEKIDDVLINFHKLRYVEEVVHRKVLAGVWTVNEEELKRALAEPSDAKRRDDQKEAGINYSGYKELQVIECHLDYAITNDSTKFLPIVALYVPKLKRVIDCYFRPFPPFAKVFELYRPFPKENLIFGESICELLDQTQEEASSIHNDRRNNSTLANSVMFKRRRGSTVPNPSTGWWPGKVWDLESMDDLEVINNVGRAYGDMISEEQFSISLAEQLVGVSDVMRGASRGQSQKGQYNTGGVLGVMAESNQRQDTNIRDVRMVLASIGRSSWILQRTFGSDDPVLETLSPETQAAVEAAFQDTSPGRDAIANFEVQASDAGANKEIARQNLMQMAQVMGQYGQSVVQMAAQLANPGLNPVIRNTMMATIGMMRGIAKELLVAFDEGELEELLPDVEKTIAAAAGGGPAGPPAGMEPAGSGVNAGALSREQLQSVASLSTGPGGAA